MLFISIPNSITNPNPISIPDTNTNSILKFILRSPNLTLAMAAHGYGRPTLFSVW